MNFTIIYCTNNIFQFAKHFLLFWENVCLPKKLLYVKHSGHIVAIYLVLSHLPATHMCFTAVLSIIFC